jgi:SAM-dependent methyltransferase
VNTYQRLRQWTAFRSPFVADDADSPGPDTKAAFYPVWAVLADRVRRSGAESVIEIGCGSGQLARLLRDLGVPSYLGVDTRPALLERARAACPGYRFDAADVFVSNHLRAGNYEVVVMTQFLEYVRWDLVALELVRPGRTVLGAVSASREPVRAGQFASTGQVLERYGPVLRNLQVEPIHLPYGRSAFLFQGVR